MFVQSDTTYKSIGSIRPPLELPDFVVLSGVNGSGKTQLLHGIVGKKISIMDGGNRLAEVKFLDHDGLRPNDTDRTHGASHVSNAQHMYAAFCEYKSINQNTQRLHPANEEQRLQLEKMFSKIAVRAGKVISELNEGDFFKYYPLDYRLQGDNVFQQRFSDLFRQYYDRKEEHEYHQYATERKGMASYPYLTDKEFIEVYGEPPWILVNRIIEEASLPYYLTVPEKLHRETAFEAKLVNKLNGAVINFSELSSGEQVIMSLTLALYNANFDFKFPELLVMDEPDAHLHPSMTKQFLDVIQNVFVREKGVKVIMTTHSPSTIALASEESLFLMNKAEPRIIKTTKDKALRILTEGVPTLSISYENRRQVFVESKYDVMVYEKVYEKLRCQLIPEISINFISSGVGGRGNCDQVKEIVNTLTKYGNRSIYGIIDWDSNNTGTEFVKVLGEGKRYSIENYIFDPILLGAFLLREKYKSLDRVSLGLSDSDRYTDFSNFDDAKLQGVADYIVNIVRTKFDNPADVNVQEIEYVGGKKIKLPSWFLQIHGHTLESKIKELFPELNRYQQEGALKEEILKKVIDDIPDFIPKDFLLVLSEIQNW